jgi:predicted GNAT family acetyltransferase/glutaredoxin-related protein|tara:strand:+ start:226 stop:792 length:567 start_codon:yes stop_codon:yes gene_type:complete
MTITMYGAHWSGDCRRAKAWFEQRHIAYTYVDLAEAPDEIDRVLERDSGVKKIPVIVFPDGSHLIEPSNDELFAHVTRLAGAVTGLTAVSAAADDDRLAVVENAHLGRFELLQHGCVVSFATYSSNDGSITVPHVETDPEHRGNGHAAQLMEGLLAIIRADGRTISPRCPFAAAHISDNEQHHDLVAV